MIKLKLIKARIIHLLSYTSSATAFSSLLI
jgi:hypothetical protein